MAWDGARPGYTRMQSLRPRRANGMLEKMGAAAGGVSGVLQEGNAGAHEPGKIGVGEGLVNIGSSERP